MLREFTCVADVLPVLDDLVEEVKDQGYTVYVRNRVLGEHHIDPMVVDACVDAGVEAISWEGPMPTFDVGIVYDYSIMHPIDAIATQMVSIAKASGQI